jgi:predicted MFS family arabinose efflux permease
VIGEQVSGATLRTSAADARLALLVLIPVALFNQVDRTILSILQVPIKRDLGLSDTQLGALTGLAFALVYCSLTIPVSRLADRMVRKFVMAAALVLWCAMTALSGLAMTFLTLALLRMGVALGESCCSPTTLSMLSDYYPRQHRGLAIAMWGSAVPLGAMVALLGGGWLTSSLGWRQTFLYVGLAGLLLAPAVLALKEPPRGQFDGPMSYKDPPPSMRQALGALWRLKSMRYLMVAGALQAFVLCSIQFWSAPFYSRVFRMPLGQVGLALAILFGLGGGVGALAGGFLVDRMGAKDVRWYGWLPAAASLIMIPLGLGQFLVRLPLLSLSLGFFAYLLVSLYLGPINAATQSLVRPNMRAFTSAMLLVFSNLIGTGLGPFITGAVSDLLVSHGFGDQSLRLALSASLLVGVGAAGAFFGAAVHLRRELR